MRIFRRLIYPIFLVFIFLGLPDSVLYNPDNTITCVMLFVFVQPFLLFITLSSFNISSRIQAMTIPLLSLLVAIPIYEMYLSKRKENSLQNDGVETKGIVYNRWLSTYRKNSNWLLICGFKVGAKTYSTRNVKDNHNKYKIGDTLTIRYYKNFPQLCVIKELENDE